MDTSEVLALALRLHSEGAAGPTTMSQMDLLKTCFRAVGTMTMMAGAGVFLNKKGVMTPQVTRALSEISMSLTIPCLLFTTAIDCVQNKSKIPCPNLRDNLSDGWPMFFLPGLYVALGLGLGRLAADYSGAGADIRNSCIAAVTFGNSTGLPITLLTLVYQNFDEGSDIKKFNPLLFLSLYLVLYPMLQWSVGAWLLQAKPVVQESPSGNSSMPVSTRSFINLLAKSRTKIENVAPDHLQVVKKMASPVRANTAQFEMGGIADSTAEMKLVAAASRIVRLGSSPATGERQRRMSSFGPDATVMSNIASASSVFVPDEEDADEEVNDTWESTWNRISNIAFRVFPPPVVAAIGGVCVALLDPVHYLFVDPGRNSRAYLQFVFEALKKIGSAAVPINMMILGNSLAKGASVSSVSPKTAMYVAFAKLVVMPAIAVVLAMLGQTFYKISNGADDSFFLVLMTVAATPTANNLMIMAELAGENKDALASIIFLQMVLSPVTLTLWLTVMVTVATRAY